MSQLSAFELPRLQVLVGSGRYIARRIASGFELVPTDGRGPIYRVQVLDDEAEVLAEFQPTPQRRRRRRPLQPADLLSP